MKRVWIFINNSYKDLTTAIFEGREPDDVDFTFIPDFSGQGLVDYFIG